MNIWDQVKAFHAAFKRPIATLPTLHNFGDADRTALHFHLRNVVQTLEQTTKVPTTGLRALRIKLLLEEVAEYVQAEIDDSLVSMADGLTDIHYIAAGTEVAYGIPGKKVFDHVHDTNMAKLGPDGLPICREDGKVMKPEGWVPPNIEQFL